MSATILAHPLRIYRIFFYVYHFSYFQMDFFVTTTMFSFGEEKQTEKSRLNYILCVLVRRKREKKKYPQKLKRKQI